MGSGVTKTDVKRPGAGNTGGRMGHINFAQFMVDRKGITDRVTLNGMTLMNWQTYLLPMDEAFMKKINSSRPAVTAAEKNEIFTGSFTLNQTGDTYIDMVTIQRRCFLYQWS